MYDHDYWCDEQIVETLEELKKHLYFAHIHERKEIENYLLVPVILERTLKTLILDRNRKTGSSIKIDESLTDILGSLTSSHKISLQGQYVGKYMEFKRSTGSTEDQSTLSAQALQLFESQWNDLNLRMKIVGGKQILKDIRTYISNKWSVTLTDIRIIDEFHESEIPEDMKILIQKIEEYRLV